MILPLPLLDADPSVPMLPKGLRQSQAAAGFHCAGADCEDSCCSGMGVVIDRPTYDKYRACPDPALKEMMDRVVVPDPQSTHDTTYARIIPSRFCPFLTDERLCVIQQRLGHGYLSRTCATYPRALNLVDGFLEQSLYLSCPEAARRVLLDPNALRWAKHDTLPELPLTSIPTLSTAGDGPSGRPYRHFPAVREFTAGLLRDRTYALWERLLILGMFCAQLDGLEDGDRDLPDVLASFRECIVTGQFRPALADVGDHPGAQVDFLVQAFDYRLTSDLAAPRFVDRYWEFREGIGYTPAATPEAITEGYAVACRRYFAPFLALHPHILENYLLAYTDRSLFPFGPQTSLYHEPKSCAEEFARLAILYALVHSLLAGMAGYYKEAFGAAHVVRGVQSFAKAVEHDLPYQKSLLASLSDSGLSNLPFLAVLLRD